MVSGFGLRESSPLFWGCVQVFRAFVWKNDLLFAFNYSSQIFYGNTCYVRAYAPTSIHIYMSM